MSEERLNELFSIVNEGYSSIQEREIRDYITNLQQKVEQLEKDNYDLDKDNQMLFEENQELKKQVEEYKKQVDKGLYNTCLPYTTGYNKAIEDKETQQKEFIKYLEDEIKFYKNRDTYIVADILGSYDLNDIKLKLLEEILQKYKSIIGVSDEKEN